MLVLTIAQVWSRDDQISIKSNIIARIVNPYLTLAVSAHKMRACLKNSYLNI